jgi:type IV secretory pathway VirB2 component (pilin)
VTRTQAQFPRAFCMRLFPTHRSLSINNNVIRVSARVAHWALLLGLTAILAFAQSSSFGQAAQGIATEMIAIAKWVGIILCIICGIGLMAGGSGTVAKDSGLLLGLVFALFASPIITWVQAL